MGKALYLFLVYSAPLLSVLVPVEHFQGVWIWLYIPFAVIYGFAMWFLSVKSMMVYVTLTPLAFLVFVLVTVPIYLGVSGGPGIALSALPLVGLIGITVSVPVGVVYVLLAYALYYIFRKYGYLRDVC